MQAPSLTDEKVDWRNQLPGILLLKLAPEYWIANKESFSPAVAGQFFAEFAEYILTKVMPEKQILDFLPLLEKIEGLIKGGAPKEEIIPMLCVYWVYHCGLPVAEELRRPEWKAFLEKWGKPLDECNMLTMTACLLVGHPFEWKLDACIAALDEFRKKRFSKKTAQIPPRIEVAVNATAANLALDTGREEVWGAIIDETVLNAAGFPKAQAHLADAKAQKKKIEVDLLLPELSATIQPQSVETVVEKSV